MKMKDVIDRVSELYREELAKERDLYNEECDIHRAILNADYDGRENISFAEYNRLTDKLESIQNAIDIQRQYCNGISCVRELLMEFGFDIDVE